MTKDYRPEIDGLRAIAVLGVLLFHFGWTGFSGGFIGVDIFFVISGFLITRLIGDEIAATGTFEFRRFYVRRMRRLFPALAVTLIVSAIAAVLIFSPEHLKRFSRELMTAALSLSNIFFFSESGYFDISKEFQALLHTWSLGVEEQFYLVWPLLMLGAFRYGKRALPLTLAGMAAVSLYFAETLDDRSAAFFLTPFRGFEFAIGAALVWLMKVQPRSQLLLEPILLLGLALIALGIFGFSSQTHHPGLLTLLPALGAALAIYAGRAPLTGWVLRNPLSVWIGKISYSLYLVHWPLLIFYTYTTAGPLSPNERLSLLAVSTLSAALMYYGVEQPLRRARPPAEGGNLRFVKGLVGTTLLFVAFGLSVVIGEGWSWRLPPETARLLASAQRRLVLEDECKYRDDKIGDGLQTKFETCLAKAGQAVLVFGDSHGNDLFNALAHSSGRPHMIGVAEGGCRPSDPKPECYYDELLDFVARNRDGLAGLVFTQKGSYLLAQYAHLPVDEAGIATVIAYLEKLAQHGVPLTWIGPQWEPHFEIDKFVATRPPAERPDYLRDQLVHIADVDAAIAAALRNTGAPVDYVSKIGTLGPLSQSEFVMDGEYTYSDRDHWSAKGEEVFGARLIASDPRLRDLLGRPSGSLTHRSP